MWTELSKLEQLVIVSSGDPFYVNATQALRQELGLVHNDASLCGGSSAGFRGDSSCDSSAGGGGAGSGSRSDADGGGNGGEEPLPNYTTSYIQHLLELVEETDLHSPHGHSTLQLAIAVENALAAARSHGKARMSEYESNLISLVQQLEAAVGGEGVETNELTRQYGAIWDALLKRWDLLHTGVPDRFIWKTLVKHILLKAAQEHEVALPGEAAELICNVAWTNFAGESSVWLSLDDQKAETTSQHEEPPIADEQWEQEIDEYADLHD